MRQTDRQTERQTDRETSRWRGASGSNVPYSLTCTVTH